MTDGIGPAVLALDALMTDPGWRDTVARARELMPPWMRDQLDAAAGQSHRMVEKIAQRLPDAGMRDAKPAEYPGWVRLGLLDSLTTWTARRGSTCTHAPDPARPMPVLAAAWKPRLVTCHGCGHLFRFPRNSVADRTCDGCGTVVDVGTVIWTGAVGAGALTYLFGACEDCRF